MKGYLKYILVQKIICYFRGHKLDVYPIYNKYHSIPDQGAYCKRCGEDWGDDVPPTGDLLNRTIRKVKYLYYKKFKKKY